MGDLIPEETALSVLSPSFTPSASPEPAHVQSLIKTLHLEPHIEGGYFVQTDASPISIPSPYPDENLSEHSASLDSHANSAPGQRLLSTTIFYYLSPRRPLGTFHRNRSRIIHTHHRGRGRYVLIYPPKDGKPARVESFVVGGRVEEGEKLQWIVEGGIWKASFLLDDQEHRKGEDSPGLLISETVVPGFEYSDHEFLSEKKFERLFPLGEVEELRWLVRKELKV